MPTKTTKTTKAAKMADSKLQLFQRLEESKLRQQRLEHALGRIRSDLMRLDFPGSHRETIDNVMKIVDNAMKSV